VSAAEAGTVCPAFAAPAADGVRVTVRLTPRAKRDAIEGAAAEADGGTCLRVRVTAPPEDGKANAALVKLLAKRLRLPASRVELVAGARDRRKVLRIDGDPEEIVPLLLGLAPEENR
jgi:uncharacterized protein